jgi:hypothetical protein
MAEIIGQAEITAINKNRTVSATICQSPGEFDAGIFIFLPGTLPHRRCQVTKG